MHNSIHTINGLNCFSTLLSSLPSGSWARRCKPGHGPRRCGLRVSQHLQRVDGHQRLHIALRQRRSLPQASLCLYYAHNHSQWRGGFIGRPHACVVRYRPLPQLAARRRSRFYLLTTKDEDGDGVADADVDGDGLEFSELDNLFKYSVARCVGLLACFGFLEAAQWLGWIDSTQIGEHDSLATLGVLWGHFVALLFAVWGPTIVAEVFFGVNDPDGPDVQMDVGRVANRYNKMIMINLGSVIVQILRDSLSHPWLIVFLFTACVVMKIVRFDIEVTDLRFHALHDTARGFAWACSMPVVCLFLLVASAGAGLMVKVSDQQDMAAMAAEAVADGDQPPDFETTIVGATRLDEMKRHAEWYTCAGVAGAMLVITLASMAHHHGAMLEAHKAELERIRDQSDEILISSMAQKFHIAHRQPCVEVCRRGGRRRRPAVPRLAPRPFERPLSHRV